MSRLVFALHTDRFDTASAKQLITDLRKHGTVYDYVAWKDPMKSGIGMIVYADMAARRAIRVNSVEAMHLPMAKAIAMLTARNVRILRPKTTDESPALTVATERIETWRREQFQTGKTP